MSIKLLLDARKLGDGGIGVYLENLLDGLLLLRSRGEADVEISLLASPEVVSLVQDSNCSFSRWHEEVEWMEEASPKYSLSEYFLMPLKRRELLRRYDVFHSPHYTLPFFLPIPSVVTVHDIIHVTHPDTFYHRPLARAMIRSALKRASHVITVSQVSQSQIKQHIGLGDDSKVTVVPNAVRECIGCSSFCDSAQDWFAAKELPEKYLLFVGSDRPHKRFSELLVCLNALLSMGEQPKAESLSIIAVGGDKCFSEDTEILISTFGLTGKVHLAGEVSNEELCCLYEQAQAVVIPSLEEGFGLVALEAMACGVPVVSTPVAAIREVCGDAAWFSSDFSGASICQAVLSMFERDEEREEKIAEGKQRAQSFNLESTAADTLAVYEEVLSLGSTRGEGEASPMLERPVQRRMGQ